MTRADATRRLVTEARRLRRWPLTRRSRKSAQLRPDEYDALVEMWGPPARVICCLREPSGYLASAVRKFPDVDVDAFRREYLADLATFEVLGGDPFVYRPDRTTEDYRRFLAPLEVPDDESYAFSYRGDTADELVTPEMVSAFDRVVARLPVGTG